MNKICILVLASSFVLAYSMPQNLGSQGSTITTSGRNRETYKQVRRRPNCRTVFDIEKDEIFEKKCETIYV